jgi:predicted RNA binding protein YcfA (HicA-like mRNA interferase family)
MVKCFSNGFTFDRQSGSHQLYYHPDGRRVTVTFHRPSDTFPPKTLKRMLENQACWSEADFERLGLL